VLLLHRVGLGRRQYPQRLVGGGDPARRCGPQRLCHDAIGLAGSGHASFTLFKVAEANRYNFLSREEIGTGTFSVEIFLTADPDPAGNATSVNS
jgi:hypothetical protein